MSTNIYKVESDAIPSFIPLGIAMDYQVRWNVHRIIRDFIQNFYDSVGYEHFADEFQYEWDLYDQDEDSVYYSLWKKGKLHIRMKTHGHSFSYEWLSCIGGSTKTGKSNYAGKYGEGFKIALLSLVKLGGDAVMSSGRWELHPCKYTEKIDSQDIEMLGYRMETREDDGFTTLDLYGISASDENIRYAEEAMLEFFYPGNILFGKKIAAADDYALYGRSAVKVPCTECKDIQGVFYYKYIARGRLPFPVVIHLTEAERDFDEDRSRDIVSQATVVRAVYEVAEKLSAEASFWLLGKMKDQWQDIPVFKKKYPADLNTWYYVICQLVRNISSDSKWVKRFVREYPVDRYAYLDRIGSDYRKNRILREAKRWFDEYNRGPDRRKLVNPIFRLLGIPSVLSEYMENRENLYREPQGKERECTELLRECARIIFSQLNSGERLPEIMLYTDKGLKKNSTDLYKNIPLHVEIKAERIFSGASGDKKIKYSVKEVVLEEADISAEEFKRTFMKYVSACVQMYGMERSARTNGVLTIIGAALYCSRKRVEEYTERWNRIQRQAE